MTRTRTCLLACLATLALATPLAVASPSKAVAPPSGASAADDVDPAILAAVKKIRPKDYPSANAVLLVDDQSVVYQEDGHFTNTTHEAELVLTPAGKAGAATMSLPYARDAEKMEVLSARVIKPSGAVAPVPSSAIQDTAQSGEMNIYDPNGRSIKVTFEGLAVGDAVDITYRLTRMKPTRAHFFNDIFQFQITEPILEASYTVDGPAALPLTAVIYHPERATIKSEKSRAGDRIHYRWSTRNSAQLVPEQLMDYSTEVPTVVVSTDPSWEHFSSWWWSVSEPQMKVDDHLKAKVAALTKNARTDKAKIKALYDFVSSDVRYRGLGVGPRTGYTPRKATETYTSRWGVCRDVAILLAAMLRADGFEAYPVLTNVGDPVLPKVAYDGFNHAIVAMPRKGGGWTYLDPTAKNSSDLLPGYEREQSALVCTGKGEKLGIIPPVPPAANMGHAVAQTQVAADGSLTSKVTIESRGMFDMILRSAAAMMPRKQQRDVVEQLIHSALPGAELVSFDLTNPLFLWKNMEVELELKVPHAVVQAGDFGLLRTLVTSGALGLVENALPRILGGLPSRKYALDAHLTFEWDEDEVVTLPGSRRLKALPTEAHARNGVSSLVATCKRGAAGSIACHRSFKLTSRFVSPSQYRELKDVLDMLGRLSRQPVILGGR